MDHQSLNRCSMEAAKKIEERKHLLAKALMEDDKNPLRLPGYELSV